MRAWLHRGYTSAYLPTALWAEDAWWKATKLAIAPFVASKWRNDRRKLPLTPEHRELYDIIHTDFWLHLNRFPNLLSCPEFNDRIQWLKLFDQRREQVECCDKLLVRDYVERRVGRQYLVDLYQAGDSFSAIDFAALPNQFVLKTNHDSGTVLVVRDKSRLDLAAVERRIQSSLSSTYGWRNGEWAYAYVRPRVFAEELMESTGPAPPADYKFYCVDGRARFVHFIYDRGFDTKDQIISPEGGDMHSRLYPTFKPGNDFVRPAQWDELVDVAQTLSAGFKCVRVDLYCAGGRVYAGEMTFWPYGGYYKGLGQAKLGKLLDFDLTTVKPFLIPQLDAELGRAGLRR